MAKPLDGVALPAYLRRLGYERATQDGVPVALGQVSFDMIKNLFAFILGAA